jgi:hypothetical protein
MKSAAQLGNKKFCVLPIDRTFAAWHARHNVPQPHMRPFVALLPPDLRRVVQDLEIAL